MEATTDNRYGIWLLTRIVLMLGCAGISIWFLVSKSINPAIVLTAVTLVVSLLDAWILRVRSVVDPISNGVRVASTIDTWQPPVAFAALAQFGHAVGDPSAGQHVLLLTGAVLTWAVILVSRKRCA
ncbi:hypothetical protein SAMN04487968_104160 [Nocardioides terrae]|uniref:Uncharacterized protein n=1 Tax=Nocardioides terrae TaxID=574651 RepID=A0A1I1HA49_9ACTN|nr:hypothetical protein [Nocardioides terrae]SFC17990.1 hypothetical protein SAMN04487968_104160 [Nocardioides terrae]